MLLPLVQLPPSPFLQRPSFPISLIRSLVRCYSLFSCSLSPFLLTKVLFYFPGFCSYYRLCYVFTSEDLEPGASDKREHRASGPGLPYSMWSFLSSSIYLQRLWFNFSLQLNNILWCMYTTFSLPINQLEAIYVVSTSFLLWIEQLWTGLSICLEGRMLSSLGICQRLV